MTYGPPSSRCILIADDDQDIRELLRLYLESEGYRVREAVDGAEVLGAVKAGGIDLVLLDIMMPRIDGYQVLRRVRETSALPVIMVSAKGQDPDKIIGLDLGAGPIYAFFRVVLPDIMPGVLSGFLLAFTMSLDDFIITHFTRGAGINTISTLVYSEVRKGINPSMYALSALIFVTVFVVLLFANFAPERLTRLRSGKEAQ